MESGGRDNHVTGKALSKRRSDTLRMARERRRQREESACISVGGPVVSLAHLACPFISFLPLANAGSDCRGLCWLRYPQQQARRERMSRYVHRSSFKATNPSQYCVAIGVFPLRPSVGLATIGNTRACVSSTGGLATRFDGSEQSETIDRRALALQHSPGPDCHACFTCVSM